MMTSGKRLGGGITGGEKILEICMTGSK